jgi:hypothetical protein
MNVQRAASSGDLVMEVHQRCKVLNSKAVLFRAHACRLPGAKVPSHLKGELAGDFGFDPLNLGADPKALAWYVWRAAHQQVTSIMHGFQSRDG